MKEYIEYPAGQLEEDHEASPNALAEPLDEDYEASPNALAEPDEDYEALPNVPAEPLDEVDEPSTGDPAESLAKGDKAPTNGYTDEQLQEISEVPTQKLAARPYDIPTQKLAALPVATSAREPGMQQKPLRKARRVSVKITLAGTGVLLAGTLLLIFYPLLVQSLAMHQQVLAKRVHILPKPSPTPTPFDPNLGAVLPTHRVVAFYAIPNAEATGPAYALTSSMLAALRKQGNAYQQLDPAHPVQPGIDLVASIPDGFPGPEGYYSHHLDAATIQSYIDFCQQNGLILFLDLNFGLAPIKSEVNFFLPYLEHYSFVEMAVDPEWMFPRHDGIPGINLSNVRASDLNPIIETLAELPMKYHVPRKILLIHQYRGDGDGLKNPYDAGLAEIADKRHLLDDPRVDVVIHVDSVGGYVGDQADKTWQYNTWVGQDMQKYHNFRYGGFKMFYHIEKKTLMSPKQVLALDPPPMVVTYGN